MSPICYIDDQTAFEDLSGQVKVSEILQFRVRFENLGRGVASPGFQVPPIGIAVIGVNNYIL